MVETKRVKNIIRTISKTYGLAAPQDGLYSNAEVEGYVSSYIEKGWELVDFSVLNRAVPYVDNLDAGVEVMYVLQLPDSAISPVEEIPVVAPTKEDPDRKPNVTKPKRGRPPKAKTTDE